MTEGRFRQLARARWDVGKLLSVGLDTDSDRIPEQYRNKFKVREGMLTFNRNIIDRTAAHAGFYKPNIAFYAGLGPDGADVLRMTIEHIRSIDDSIPVILDGKRADIGNTNRGYVAEARYYNADAVTVNPYFGEEALEPFFGSGLGIIVLCKTSNPGSKEFQDRLVLPTPEEVADWGIPDKPLPFYQLVAYRVSRAWKHGADCALVVGATYPQELGEIRRIVDDMPILVPGIGKQGGDIAQVLAYGLTEKGDGLIINSSSDIIFSASPSERARQVSEEILTKRAQLMHAR